MRDSSGDRVNEMLFENSFMTFARIPVAILAAVIAIASCSSTELRGDELDWLSGENTGAISSDEPSRLLPRSSLRRVGGALGIVLGGFILLTVVMKKSSPSSPVNAMMEPLGSVQIAPKVRLHLVRFGARILVLHISGQNVQRVAELEDPDEVKELLTARVGSDATSVPVSVSKLLQTAEQDLPPAMRGFNR